MTNEQKRVRNWQKLRLSGITINRNVLSPSEQFEWDTLMLIRNRLLSNWDNETELLIGHTLPPHRCDWCNKRSKISHMFRGRNFCAKHYKYNVENDTERQI